MTYDQIMQVQKNIAFQLKKIDHKILEMILVLFLSFGYSGLCAIFTFIEMCFSPQGIAGTSTNVNPQLAHNPWIDIAFRGAYIVKLLAIGALGWYLLNLNGLDIGKKFSLKSDLIWSVLLASFIGIPGLVLVIIARALKLNVQLSLSESHTSWLILVTLAILAFANGWAEEIIVVSYLSQRLQGAHFSYPKIILCSAALRSSYHFYQGIGGAVGNFIMGIIFACFWLKTKKIWPLIGAHALIDCVAFDGFAVIEQIHPSLLNFLIH